MVPRQVVWKTAFRRRDLPTYGVSSLLIRGLRHARANVGGLLRRCHVGKGGQASASRRTLRGAVWLTPAAVKSDCCAGPDSYDPRVATNSSSWSVVQDGRVKSPPPGCWGSSLDFHLMRTPLTDLPPCRQRTFSAGVFFAPYLLSLDARTLSQFGHPFPFPSPSPFNPPSDPLTLFLSFHTSASGSFLGPRPFLLLVIPYY